MSKNFDNTRIIMAAANSARQREVVLTEGVEVARGLYLGYLRLHLLLFRTIHLDWNDVIDSVIFTQPGLRRLLDSVPRDGTGPKVDIRVPNLDLRKAYCVRLFDPSGRHLRPYFWSIIEQEHLRREATRVFAARKPTELTSPQNVKGILRDYVGPEVAEQSYFSLDYLRSFQGDDQVLIRKARRRPSLGSDIMVSLQPRLQTHLRTREEQGYFEWVCNYIARTESILRADVHNQYWNLQHQGRHARGLWQLTTLFDNRYYAELAKMYRCVCAPEGISWREFDRTNRERVLLGDYFSSTCRRLGIEVPQSLLLAIGTAAPTTFVEAYAKASKHLAEWWNLDPTARALSQVHPDDCQAADKALRRAIHEFLKHIGPKYDTGVPGELQRVDTFLTQTRLVPTLLGAGGGALVGTVTDPVTASAAGVMLGRAAEGRLPSPWFNALANRIVRYAFRVRFPGPHNKQTCEHTQTDDVVGA